MKEGIFNRLPLVGLLLLTFFILPGCADLLIAMEEDEAALDRGYVAEATEESDECTGRFCQNTVNTVRQSSDAEEEVRRVHSAIQARDVILGMTRQQVSASWGEPSMREAAGSGSTGHERWVYGSKYSLSGSRTVIFENGKVAGWGK